MINFSVITYATLGMYVSKKFNSKELFHKNLRKKKCMKFKAYFKDGNVLEFEKEKTDNISDAATALTYMDDLSVVKTISPNGAVMFDMADIDYIIGVD